LIGFDSVLVMSRNKDYDHDYVPLEQEDTDGFLSDVDKFEQLPWEDTMYVDWLISKLVLAPVLTLQNLH
jgi:hypothetical protein